MGISMHTYISGVPHRSKYVEQVYEHITSKPDVLMWTGEQVYEWYKNKLAAREPLIHYRRKDNGPQSDEPRRHVYAKQRHLQPGRYLNRLFYTVHIAGTVPFDEDANVVGVGT